MVSGYGHDTLMSGLLYLQCEIVISTATGVIDFAQDSPVDDGKRQHTRHESILIWAKVMVHVSELRSVNEGYCINTSSMPLALTVDPRVNLMEQTCDTIRGLNTVRNVAWILENLRRCRHLM